jgi:hypothetical protein
MKYELLTEAQELYKSLEILFADLDSDPAQKYGLAWNRAGDCKNQVATILAMLDDQAEEDARRDEIIIAANQIAMDTHTRTRTGDRQPRQPRLDRSTRARGRS